MDVIASKWIDINMQLFIRNYLLVYIYRYFTLDSK
jgi:hypothetical protein